MIFIAVLSAKARALLSTGRAALRPTHADRERIENALRARLGAVVPQPRAVGSGWQLMSGILVSVGLVGGALFFAFRHGPGSVSAAHDEVLPIATQAAALVIEPPTEAPLPVASPAAARAKQVCGAAH